MGRTENPVDRTLKAVAELAEFQRLCRTTAGLTYAELATVTGVPETTLRRAASGRGVPSRDVVVTAVTGCGGSDKRATELWKKARYYQRLADSPRRPAPALHLARDKGDLSAALAELYEENGARRCR